MYFEIENESVYVLVREDGTFCIRGFDIFASDLTEAPTYTLGETKKVILEPGEKWEVIIPASDN